MSRTTASRPIPVPARRPAMLALALGVAACAGTDRVDGGIDTLPRLRLEKVVRVGSVDDPVAGFSSITALDVDADGRAYVLEAGEREVRVYDASGHLLDELDVPWLVGYRIVER